MKNDIFVVNIPLSSLPRIKTGPWKRNMEEIGDQSGSSSYWSWTFGLTTFPFIFWGCPFYLIVRTPPRHFPLALIPTTKTWIQRMFDCCISPLASTLSLLLFIPTTLINIYVVYVFCDIFHYLFISGTYAMSMFHDILVLIRYLPVVIPLNYVWFRGYRVNNMIVLLNSLHKRYGGVGCAGVRFRLFLMLIANVGIQVIRYFCYERYDLAGKPFLEVAKSMLEFSVDFFCALLLPVYCVFCDALRFQLFIVKALVYQLIGQRVIPKVEHLDMMKILYTQAADHIVLTNDLFGIYLSLVLVILFVGTILDAQNLWRALLMLYGSGSGNQFTAFLAILAREGNGTAVADGDDSFTAADIREVNADIACIVITYGLMFFTIWQAVGTNDLARESHVWLNDFVAGGGGTDVRTVLLELGVKLDVGRARRRKESNDIVVLVDHTEEGGLVWGRNSLLEFGMHDEFLKKFQMLKAYMHARMQLEKPALLNITLVGILVPSLSGRLRRYQMRF